MLTCIKWHKRNRHVYTSMAEGDHVNEAYADFLSQCKKELGFDGFHIYRAPHLNWVVTNHARPAN